MSVLFLDCGMGAAGDMISAALYELLDDKAKTNFIEKMNNCGIEGVRVCADESIKGGIAGTHMSVYIDGAEEMDHHHHHEHDHHHEEHHDHNHDHHHDDNHNHHHTHHHSSLKDVHEIIDKTPFSINVKKQAKKVYDVIAQAESLAHGREVSEIHFHEVGMKDAIIDVVGACVLFEMLGVEHVYATPVRLGFGQVHCAHGIVPVPAPATAHILEGVPVYAGDIKGEMCTPTGAAILKTFVEKYMEMPALVLNKVGYGMGKKDFERVNCVRAILADSPDSRDVVIELSTNLDDMTGEELAFAEEIMREAGALEVYTQPIYMKKDRPGVILTVMCKECDEEKIAHLFFKHTSTWGIRRREVERLHMDRSIETKDTEFGSVRVKTGSGYGVTRSKVEYEDVARIAKDKSMSISEVMKALKGILTLLIVILPLGILSGCGNQGSSVEETHISSTPVQVETPQNEETEEETTPERTKNPCWMLNVPTQITKINDLYFIVDCYNNQAIYNENITDPINEWSVMTSDIVMGHTVASDGEVYLIDDTENHRILVMEYNGTSFDCTQVFENIGNRPHFIVYNEDDKAFYVWSSMTGQMYVFEREADSRQMFISRVMKIDELDGVYVRSFTIDGDSIYLVSGNSQIIEARITDFKILKKYVVPSSMSGMIQIMPVPQGFYITVSTDVNGNQDFATMIFTEDLENLESGEYTDIYSYFVGGGTPYYMGKIDDRYFLTEHRIPGHSIWSFDVDENGMPKDVVAVY